MIIDTSAIVAVLSAESDAPLYAEAIAGAAAPVISAGTYLECGIVVNSLGRAGLGLALDGFLEQLQIAIQPVTREHAVLARAAYREFGKGNHPARLNFGDCFSYALAVHTGQPLLWKGDDFTHTGIPSALEA